MSTSSHSQQPTDRFGAVALSPKTRDPLIVPGSSALEAMSSPCMAISIRVVAAVGLRAMQKGLTSHPMVEVSLVHDDGSASPANAWNMGNDLKGGARTPSSASAAPSSARGSGGGHPTRPLRSPVVKSSLNPIWNFDVDFGDVDTESVVGVLFVVRHVEKLGMVKKDMGELMLSLREVMDLKMQPPHEQDFHLQPTKEMAFREVEEGPTNRKYGKLTIRFNGYGVPSTTTAPSNYTMMSEARLSGMPEHAAAVAHEDDFARSSKSIVVHDVKAEVRTLQAYHQTRPAAGEVWYAISTPWIQQWLLFVSKYKGDEARNPGQIDNMALIADDLMNGTFQLRADLRIKTHFRVINKKSWDYYQLVYGGGPAIEIHVPATCANPGKWIANVRLEDVARVGTNYVDSDSD